jgi:predicted Rossmann fold nucleotide-binding protein DprA/Smf involved in DNA uptake
MSAVKKELKELAGQLQQLHKRMEKVLKTLENFSIKGNSEPAEKSVSSARGKKKPTDSDKVVSIIKRYKNGVDVNALRQKTGFNEKKISNIVFRASQKGRIKRVGRGLYVAVK